MASKKLGYLGSEITLLHYGFADKIDRGHLLRNGAATRARVGELKKKS
jgi:hypothetical protein